MNSVEGTPGTDAALRPSFLPDASGGIAALGKLAADYVMADADFPWM